MIKKYKYPRMGRCAKYIKVSENVIHVVDYVTGKSFECSVETASFVRKLDGKTPPLSIPTALSDDEISMILEFLEDEKYLEQSRVRRMGSIRGVGVWYPKNTKTFRRIARLWNTLLLLLWLPFLLAGVLLAIYGMKSINYEIDITGCLVGLVVSVIIHELSHAFAAVAYGARAFELGIGVFAYIIPCCYVIADSALIRQRLKRVQFLAAGIESGFLLFGLFAILGVMIPAACNMFLSGAFINVFLALSNLIFFNGVDGYSIMAELIGTEIDSEGVFLPLASPIYLKNLTKKGAVGYALILIYIIIALTHLAVPFYVIATILEFILIL